MLLKTRFYLPPLRKNSVDRQKLIGQLEQVSGGQVVLISAPAGYGKTTLVSQWLHKYPQSFCWLTLGNEHNSPSVFWQYAITAIQQTLPSVGIEASSLVSESAALDSIVISLLNDLDELCVMNHSDDAITIVLDDFHYLQDQELLRILNLFLDHLPPSIRMVFTSRTEPAISAPKRRANAQLFEVTQENLRFTESETETFLRGQVSDAFPIDQVKKIYKSTEGWVTGIQLSALSFNRGIAINDPDEMVTSAEHLTLDRNISDYLFDEVFESLDKEVQVFLLVMSRSKRFCAGLCNRVLAREDSYKLIEQLEKANLFIIPLDNHRTWYRFHDLFRQFLWQPTNLISSKNISLYVKASVAWLEEYSHTEDAIELSISHSLWRDSIRLLEQLSQGTEGYSTTSITNWLQQVPSDEIPKDSCLTAIHELKRVHNQITKTNSETGLVEVLTKREEQVLLLISQGLSNQEIVDQLFISLNTLKVHIRNLYGKMGVETRREAMVKARTITENV